MIPRIAQRCSSWLVLAAVVLLAGLAAGGAARPATAHRAQASGSVTVQAHEFGYDAPDTLPAGTVQVSFQNGGTLYHMLQFLQLNDGVSADDLQAAVASGSAYDALALGTPAGGANAIDAGDTQDVTLTLTPGSYVMLCFVYTSDGIPHAQKGMVHPFTVTDEQSPATPPAADLTVGAQDYSFDVPAITPGQHTIQFVNQGPQPHEMAVVRLPDNASPDELQQALAGADISDESANDPAGGLSVISPGQASWATVSFTPGTYMFVCYMKDADTGLPHAALGMSQIVVVPETAGAAPPTDAGSSGGNASP